MHFVNASGADTVLNFSSGISNSIKTLYLRTQTDGTTQSTTVTNKLDCTAQFSVNCKSAISPKLYVNGTAVLSKAGCYPDFSYGYISIKNGDKIYLEITGTKHDSIAMVTYVE